ncbi:MAG TPA: hypothetical protein VFW83_09900 [Bryobacteraceae bacterium]|nr:hypothetical protein [Bryobacteraceae bacterium]
MEGDRKYRQRGYMDSSRDSSHSNGAGREERPRPQGPRPPLDATGPRLPRLVQAVTAARCFNCSAMLPTDVDFRGSCPKCGTALHCCKQCAHFEPSTRFQCLKPVPVRIAAKDHANECELFKPRVTVARDAAHGPSANGPSAGPAANVQAPRSVNDARAAFDSLFRKPD